MFIKYLLGLGLFLSSNITFAAATTPIKDPQQLQAQKLTESMASLQRMIDLLRLQKNKKASKISRLLLSQRFAQDNGPQMGGDVPIPPNVESKAAKLLHITQSPTCYFDLPEDKDLQVGQDKVAANIILFHVGISGDGCPVEMNIDLKGTQTANHIDADFDWSYKAHSEEYKAESDITELKQHGSISVDFDGTSASQVLNLKASISGSGLSKTIGLFSSTHNLSGDFSFSPPLNIKFKLLTEHIFDLNHINFALKSEASLNGIFSTSEHYYLNGADITKDVYQALEQGIQFFGINEKKDDATLPLNCSLLVSDLSNNVLNQINSCQQNSNSDWNYQGRVYNLSFKFTKNWVESKILDKANKSEKTIYSLYNEDSSYTKDFNSLHLTVTCNAVATCQ